MTKIPAYWTSPLTHEFEVSIESVEKSENYYHIQIREDVIRPAGGGQAGDRGFLYVEDTKTRIHDTISDASDIVLITDGPVPEGSKGHLEIDMDWRLSMMRNHTAQHLFVSFLRKREEKLNVGNLWIDGIHGTVELVGAKLNHDVIFEAEEEVTKVIEEDISVNIDFVDSDEIGPSVRSREGLSDRLDKLRIVSVGHLDQSACSGIHVPSTGAIGFFKVIDFKMNDERTSVEFLTGIKATITVSNLYNEVLRRKYDYPYEMDQLGAVLDRSKEAIDIKQKLIEKITTLLTSDPSAEWISSVHFKHEYLPGFDANTLKILANQIEMKEPTVLLLFAPGRKSHVVLKTNEMPREAAAYIRNPIIELGGRGGGKAELFSGGFVDCENSENLYESLVSLVRELIV